MDSTLSFHTSTNNAISQPQQPPSPPPPHNAHSQPPLLVPKPEPFWASAHDDIGDELDLFTEFNRVTELFHLAFGATNVVVPPYSFGPQPAAPACSDPLPAADVHSAVQEHPNSSSSAPDASRAIVPMEDLTVSVPPRRKQSRQKELVRVMGMSVREQAQLRETVRRTRLVYDSLRVYTAVEEERRVAALAAAAAAREAAREAGVKEEQEEEKVVEGRSRRLRGDLRAAGLMRERGLWLNREQRIVGAIPGILVGDLFLFRMELCVLGLHGQIQAGIDYLPASMSSSGEPIATSVIVSGGYEDDSEDGEDIFYTGHGGQGKNSSKQVADQKLESGNLALERSMHYGVEVRVIRGMRYEGSASASGKVYVYEGVYKITDCQFVEGKSGFGVYKFRLSRIEGQAKTGSAILKEARDIRMNVKDANNVRCLSADMSNKKENVPVRLFNDIDDDRDPLNYEYLAKTSFPQFVFHQSGNVTGCDCVNGCGDGCFCAKKNGGDFPYTLQGHLVKGKPLIFECGPFCSCTSQCRNRVSQKGLKYRLEVFRSLQTSWGVRSLDLIQAGTFICEFSGVVLTREQAQLVAINGDSSIYPNRFSKRWAEWGDLSQVDPKYVRPSYPSIPPLDFSLNVSTMRNVACYMSHSSSPNVLVQFVLYDHNNLMFPHLMLFAMENIPPMRELSLDYGVADEWTGKLSICN
ncbi:histone-lysine N-methyltransferase family member SUVH9 [Vigna radiata var. radiata]|uniref:Histone-lysine N-methyltransferase family member SUVH9 n=1 Tax=Vigna radiata var. radiata TaxID=3916 RepID=A0A1S3UII4_VIGRR|nr:histone-lysine N-methyltransferase family member SUVH9 [Vigna radiata var. radiata]XP_014505843.1 histone-lysine N-methyltransferase family member SUVH9 [Vigna radiata var. radiata]XP_022638666.1 histone-lysine N-methyltransferase family member SUVH9 [Vigna radiata var. radiata]XP_022638667.1 histone-lysine N-methyltransferase family member SUVH9 [Vigna radiata var. radiata]XP_022638668.1 histone-lysine N-methyltransferase family member SUVH9 [Vigna radiata var. radiata]